MGFESDNYVVTCYSLDETRAIFEIIKQLRDEIYCSYTEPSEISGLMWNNSKISERSDCSLTIEHGNITGYCWKEWYRGRSKYNDFVYITAEEFLSLYGAPQTCNIEILL